MNHKKKRSIGRVGSIISAAVPIAILVIWEFFILWLWKETELPTSMILLYAGIPAIIIVGILIALIQRLKEIKGGEIDEAGDY